MTQPPRFSTGQWVADHGCVPPRLARVIEARSYAGCGKVECCTPVYSYEIEYTTGVRDYVTQEGRLELAMFEE